MEKGFFERKIELRFCDCDYKKRARVAILLANMADIAGVAYAAKGYSHSWLWERNYVFLVSRVAVKIKRMPKADEVLEVTTWEREIKGVLFYRDFTMKDMAGNVIVEGTTAWVLANPVTRQILRPSEFEGVTDAHPDIKADTLPLSKLKPPKDMQQVGTRRIVYSDIDANGHVYNAVYLSIACDNLPSEFLENDISDFQINFKQEAKLGQDLAIKTSIVDNIAYITGEFDGIISYEAMIKTKRGG